jgi:hypothetical protein
MMGFLDGCDSAWVAPLAAPTAHAHHGCTSSAVPELKSTSERIVGVSMAASEALTLSIGVAKEGLDQTNRSTLRLAGGLLLA